MTHLNGFWDPRNWADDKWAQYLKKKRSSFKKRLADCIDQLLHRLMAKFMSRQEWEDRERNQWPSSTGSYDPCADHYNWLLGAGHKEEAQALREEARARRPEFLA
jgi:hypothetical protein